MYQGGVRQLCWCCGVIINSPEHLVCHYSEKLSTANKSQHVDRFNSILDDRQGDKKNRTGKNGDLTVGEGKDGDDKRKKDGKYTKPLDPPDGVMNNPWDILQLMAKICRKDTPPPRKDSYLPYLVIRSNPSDRGQRPLPDGTVFWESPDIFVMPNQPVAGAPDIPTSLGGMAQAGVPNTLFAHIWNLGRSPAFDVRVEFYWFNPTLGINQSDANLIGFTYVTLGNRNSARSHTIVRCPTNWVPAFVNNGHECLVVRAHSPISDPLGSNAWNTAQNRHVGQRNISVTRGSQGKTTTSVLKVSADQNVQNAQVVTVNVDPKQVPWMELLIGKRNPQVKSPAITPLTGLMRPTVVSGANASQINLAGLSGESLKNIIATQHQFARARDPLEVMLVAKVEQLSAQEAHVVRTEQIHDSKLVGGYTTIFLP